MNEQKTAKEDLMTDAEVAGLLRVSVKTLRNHLKDGPPTQRMTTPCDIRLVDRITVGGQRRWVRDSLMEMLTKTT